jgi:glycosyltransferase involved in cell wall biosynthesis
MSANLERLAAEKLKILCLTSNDPAGQDSGGVIRVRNIFRLLARLGQIRLVLAGDFQDDTLKPDPSPGGFELVDAVQFQPTGRWSLAERWQNEFDGRFLNITHSQARISDRERLERLIAAHDIVWVHNLQLANRYGLWRWPHSVLDIDDIPSSQYSTALAQAKSFGERFRCQRQIRLWQRRENFLLQRFNVLCVCSEADRRLLGGRERIFVLPNAFNAPERVPVCNPVMPPRIGFVGNFAHQPNVHGMQWLVENVWPLILKQAPSARLRVIGKDGEKQPWSRANGIDILGWIADTESEMASWSLAAIPIFLGGGTRIKLAEAFSRKCPVVATSLGAYGYEVGDGDDLLVADTAENFTEKCVRIINDPLLGKMLAENAWEKFNQKWTWEAQSEKIVQIVERVLSDTTTYGGR